jgi:ribosomal-protein-alanine N-acetyltransferase
MPYKFRVMTQEQAEEIAYNWHYDSIYSFYDITADEEDLAEFLDPKQRGDSKFTVYKKDEVIGFFSFTQKDPNTIDIGLGMKPELTGKGLGLEFIEAGIQFAKKEYSPQLLTLSVATFNKRAITVYKRAGFEPIATFEQKTNGSLFEFVKMKYSLVSKE